MRQNRLSVDISKTKVMLLGSKQRLKNVQKMSISLNRETGDTVETFKYLGITLDQQLQFHPHIDYIVDKTTTKLGLLYKTRSLFNENTALML